METAFDDDRLARRLARLPHWKRQVFLLLVCERLLPSIALFDGETRAADEARIRAMLDRAWSRLSGVEDDAFDSRRDESVAEQLAPDPGESSSLYVSSAMDAAIATSLLMRSFRDEDVRPIVEGASLARDSVDLYVQEIENMNPADPVLEQSILVHPLMQRELRRQREDLERLERVAESTERPMADLHQHASTRKGGRSLFAAADTDPE